MRLISTSSSRNKKGVKSKRQYSTVITATHPVQLRGLRRHCHKRSLFGFGDIHGCEIEVENKQVLSRLLLYGRKGTRGRESIATENKNKCRLKH